MSPCAWPLLLAVTEVMLILFGAEAAAWVVDLARANKVIAVTPSTPSTLNQATSLNFFIGFFIIGNVPLLFSESTLDSLSENSTFLSFNTIKYLYLCLKWSNTNLRSKRPFSDGENAS